VTSSFNREQFEGIKFLIVRRCHFFDVKTLIFYGIWKSSDGSESSLIKLIISRYSHLSGYKKSCILFSGLWQ